LLGLQGVTAYYFVVYYSSDMRGTRLSFKIIMWNTENDKSYGLVTSLKYLGTILGNKKYI